MAIGASGEGQCCWRPCRVLMSTLRQPEWARGRSAQPPCRPPVTASSCAGGKDSTVLAHIMTTLNKRHDYGLNLFLLSIDEGITGRMYSHCTTLSSVVHVMTQKPCDGLNALQHFCQTLLPQQLNGLGTLQAGLDRHCNALLCHCEYSCAHLEASVAPQQSNNT